MKNIRKILLALIALLMLGMLIADGKDNIATAKEKTAKWTATTNKNSYEYTGEVIRPKVTVKYKGRKLSKKNYKLTYPKKSVNPGTYKIKITLRGKYKGKKLKGTKTIKYSIVVPKIKSLKCSYETDEYAGDSIYYTWEKNYNVDGYEIEESNNGTYDAKTKKRTLENYYSGSYCSVYECGVTYSFRIRAYKKIGKKTHYSKWSKISKKIPLPEYDMTTKSVNGIDVAYSKEAFPFFKDGVTDSDNVIQKKITQCYFPVLIKKKLNNDFVIHTEYNGECGFNNFSNKQYIPNRKNAQVVSSVSVVYFDEMPIESKMQQAFYKQGYVGYVLFNVSCLSDKNQSVDLYFGDKKVETIVSNGYSKSKDYSSCDYSEFCDFAEYLSPAYSYRTEKALQGVLDDVAKCAPDMTDYDTYEALKYWIRSHSYRQYTCWGAATVANAMTEFGYPYIVLYCSYSGENGLYNDYSRYYSGRSKQQHNALGHMITLIFMDKGKYAYCAVQGQAGTDSEFEFDPTGFIRPTGSLDDILVPASDKFGLNEYDTIEELMRGDYNVDINKYDAFDWHTWIKDVGILDTKYLR